MAIRRPVTQHYTARQASDDRGRQSLATHGERKVRRQPRAYSIPNFFDTCAIIYVKRNVAVLIGPIYPNWRENCAMSKRLLEN